MSRKRSESTQNALDEIKNGMTAYAACKKYNVNQSVVSKILNKKEKKVCAECGSRYMII